MIKIKYCIWDVGNVIYDYSLEPLHRWMAENTADKALFEERKGRYSYNDYMKGLVPYDALCRDLCDFYAVSYQPEYSIALNRAFHQGVGHFYLETRQMMTELDGQGIKNCVLSNALPILKNTARVDDLIPQERQFTSYDLGLLKPDPAIYAAVRNQLGCAFEELIFVDDKPRNTKAAAELGIRAVTFKPQTVQSAVRTIVKPPAVRAEKEWER